MGNLKGLAMAGQDTLPSSAAVKPALSTAAEANDPPLVLSTACASPAQKRLALAAVVLLAAAFAVTAALSTAPVGYVGKFVPAYATAIFVVTCITSALLFVQFSIVRSRALLVISSGYLFTALITVPWALTFPDLLGETAMSISAWGILSRLWHLGIPLAVIGYVLLKVDVTVNRAPRASLSVVIVAGIAAVLLAVASLALFAAISNELLPKVPPASIDFERPLTYLNVLTMFVTFLALALLWSRWRSVLDLWLMVTLCGWVVELSLIFLVGGRVYVLGWYAGRLYGLLASTCVLAVLLSESASLYARLARAALEERHRRQAQLITMDVLSASIAHEMNQPLTSVVTNADAALRWLIRPAPDLDEVSASLERIRRSANHAGDVIRSIRALVKKDQRNRETVAINDLIRETIVLVQDGIQRHRISVTLDLAEVLPFTISDRTQLQQVLINLVSNAIDAMALESRSRRLRIRSALQPPDVIAVSVEDNGPGIAPEVADRIFNPLVTTKSHGMGMGLAICRAIIEAHEGRLSTSPAAGGGTVFQFVLPSSTATAYASRA